MLKSFNCPICKNNEWNVIEKYSFLKTDGDIPHQSRSPFLRKLRFVVRVLFFARPRNHVVTSDAVTPFQKSRIDIMFNVWFKNESKVELSSIFCETCGFTCYLPRPQDRDIAGKYMYSNKRAYTRNRHHEIEEVGMRLDNKRAERIYRSCLQHLTKKSLNILDYGGADGKILTPFLNSNNRCFIIDYNDSIIPGVMKVGNDIHDAVIDRKYDLIICSHVLEHVSDFIGLINKLKEHLEEDGIIYAEVPQEIWAGISLETDPVTHINFFTRNSFINLFLSTGFEVLDSARIISNYGTACMEVIWIIVRKNRSESICLLPTDTRAMLFPSRIYSVKKLICLLFKQAVARITIQR